MKKTMALVMSIAMIACLVAGCGSSSTTSSSATSSAASSSSSSSSASSEASSDVSSSSASSETSSASEAAEKTTLYIDIAASLEAVFVDCIIPAFEEEYPNVEIVYNAGSSGKLLQGIEEANGIGHDLFFSAGKAQVKTLDETDGLVVEGSIVNLLKNELCLVKGNDVETAVTSFETINQAKSAAICGGSVPVGKYTRIALVSLGFLPETESPADYTTDQISEALGGIEIDEADDVEVAASKAVEQSVEVATIYYSDYYNHQDDLTIIAQDDGTLTGDIIYPVCLVSNPEATDAETTAAADLLAFLQTEQCLDAFAEYCFIVNQ